MVKYFLIIFLSICAFPLKSNAWVGVWLGLEAGVAALDLVTEELSGNSYSSSSKKGKVICIDRNGHQLHNLQVCPPNHKPFTYLKITQIILTLLIINLLTKNQII